MNAQLFEHAIGIWSQMYGSTSLAAELALFEYLRLLFSLANPSRDLKRRVLHVHDDLVFLGQSPLTSLQYLPQL